MAVRPGVLARGRMGRDDRPDEGWEGLAWLAAHPRLMIRPWAGQRGTSSQVRGEGKPCPSSPLAGCGPGREAACHGRQAAPRVRRAGHRCPGCAVGAASCEEGRNPRETRAGSAVPEPSPCKAPTFRRSPAAHSGESVRRIRWEADQRRCYSVLRGVTSRATPRLPASRPGSAAGHCPISASSTLWDSAAVCSSSTL